MPRPYCKITIVKRDENESDVSAVCQSGEKLFSEYDQQQKYYPYKNEVPHKERQYLFSGTPMLLTFCPLIVPATAVF